MPFIMVFVVFSGEYGTKVPMRQKKKEEKKSATPHVPVLVCSPLFAAEK